MRHPDDPSVYKDQQSKSVNFTMVFQGWLLDRFVQDNYTSPPDKKQKWEDFGKAVQSGMHIKSETPWGETLDWIFGPNSGVKFTLADWNNPLWQRVSADNKPMHWETNSYSEGNKLTVRWTLTTDTQHNLVYVVAIEHPDLLTSTQWRILFIAGPGTVLRESKLPQNILQWDRGIYHELVPYAEKNFFPNGGENTGPFLVVEPSTQ